MNIWNDIKKNFSTANTLTRLIYFNVFVFLVFLIFAILSFLFDNPDIESTLLDLLAIPASLNKFLVRPWTLVTYMFTHKDIWHILFNMLWLFWFGKIFLEYLDQRKLVAVYLLGGISGAIVYVASFNIFPAFTGMVSDSVAIGASASVMAVVIATAVYVPDYAIVFFLIGRIRIKYVALAIFILTSFMDFSVNSGGKLAHIGGAIFGFLYMLNLRKGRDIGKGFNKIIDFFATLFKPGKKLKVSYKKPVTDYDYNKVKADRQARINQILDKISKGGYDSLTKEEKELLFSESQKKN
ncbi:MAG TPA: rhomboid family intramembrane serine protease [Bacteroidales bacterium]|jgi:membrane associated rhomboid family serine protease|nr:rhomboid family intramembrane serine protease [Bacteroidales bacterium]OQB62561.1 MAG: Rhomboid family protein [Bacteroidetes bacterium ADurb.Bin145]NMD02030.1 rhomboid family intramembrane serine protease [Bacteroidales bacterium]HOU01224.1 rhomboid family intramembrane serine protease [Bacteroidales bacterium]HQG63886.1 rhomboid family intramembrane serine protease [Bacteroidales bacterium]